MTDRLLKDETLDADAIRAAVDALRDCSSALMRVGGMLNKDLARDAVKVAAVLQDFLNRRAI